VPELTAAIFDMDGLLIDSEPAWRRAEVEVFATVGLELTERDCEATTGLRIDEVARHWFARAPWEGPSPHEVAERIVDRMTALVAAEGVPMPGAHEAVERCRAAGLRLGLASSSAARLIDATLERLDLRDAFEVRCSAQHERWGKPHPAVFLTCAARLGVAPSGCLVLEDSLNGVIAAKAARMRCVAVPEATQRGDARFALADRVLDSLEALDAAALAALGA
jgi:sugar-phosphatase